MRDFHWLPAGVVWLGLATTIGAGPGAGVDQEVLALEGDISPVHDPVVIKEKNTYYVFCTGGRNGQGVIPIRTSSDMFFHAYFGEGRGRGSALQISTLVWEDGWPKAGALP
jgi:hypothetical protein